MRKSHVNSWLVDHEHIVIISLGGYQVQSHDFTVKIRVTGEKTSKNRPMSFVFEVIPCLEQQLEFAVRQQ